MKIKIIWMEKMKMMKSIYKNQVKKPTKNIMKK